MKARHRTDHRRPARFAGIAAALSLALVPAVPAAAGPFEDLAPCFSVQHGLDGLVTAFVADGWTVATDDTARQRAAAATAEINWALRYTPGRFRSPEQATEFLATAHGSHDRRTDPFVLLVRDDRNLILEWSTNGSRGQNICLQAAPRIDYVDAAIPAGAVDPARSRFFAAVDVPLIHAAPHVRQVQATLVRLRVPDEVSVDLVGGDGVQLSVTYKWE